MKKLVTLFVCALIALSTAAQNRLMAETEFESAEKAFSSGRYEDALRNLDKAQEYAGQWLPAISYLRIVSLEKLRRYNTEEVNRYMEYANSNSDNINRDQFREVYAISQKMASATDYNEGERLYNARDYAQALPKLRAAADNGWEQAMNRLGQMYNYGRGVTEDKAMAVEWYRKAAEKGYAVSMSNLANMYYGGSGVTKDYAKAVEWYEKAAANGNVDAMYYAGNAYATGGYGLTQDYAKAFEWYIKAADKGQVNAMVSVGYAYIYGRGVTKSYGEGVIWFNKADESGNLSIETQMYISVYYSDNNHYTESVKWLKKAAERGYADAQQELGERYSMGVEGVTQDYTEALKWYRKAAEQGKVLSMFRLGILYNNGQGVAQNRNEAIKWIRLAAENGSDGAKTWLERNNIR